MKKEKKFGIIVCPNCKKPKIINLSVKQTKCFSCNRTLFLKKLKVVYKSDSQGEIRDAIGLLNAELDGNLEKFKKILENKKFY